MTIYNTISLCAYLGSPLPEFGGLFGLLNRHYLRKSDNNFLVSWLDENITRTYQSTLTQLNFKYPVSRNDSFSSSVCVCVGNIRADYNYGFEFYLWVGNVYLA